TINRVARKIESGEIVRAQDPYSYFYGVARLVFMEVVRAREKERTAFDQAPLLSPLSAEVDPLERHRECLEACLQKLPAESRALILQYHQGEKGVKITNRQRLAEQLQIPLNALRIRAHRIREQLETCVHHHLKS